MSIEYGILELKMGKQDRILVPVHSFAVLPWGSICSSSLIGSLGIMPDYRDQINDQKILFKILK